MRVRNVCLGEKRRELPGIGDVTAFQPGLNCFLSLDPLEFVLELGRLQGRPDPLLALCQFRAVFWTDGRGASHLAEARQTIAKRSGGTARRSRWIIQLVRKTRGKFAQCRELFSLLADHREASYAIGQHPDQALREFRHAMQHLRKVFRVHGQGAHRTDGACCQGHFFHSRERKVAGYGRRLRRIGWTVNLRLPPSTYFAFEHD